jgi:hypothetical protein
MIQESKDLVEGEDEMLVGEFGAVLAESPVTQ